ncbi:MAG: pseudouridine synthase [Eggerthellaceae bacterium]|nr:pseudouridine synthase [Eggerthellaceae bacterium]
MRLQKYLARSGMGGRRHCEKMIADGRVQVNGRVIEEMGVQVDPRVDVVMLDGKVVELPADEVVVALNKPVGCYSTMRDQVGRFCIADLLPTERYPSLYHIGRLDRDTTGILLLSTDGELGNALLHPSKHVTKEYIAQVKGRPTEAELDRIRTGIEIRRGERYHSCAPAEAEVLDVLPKRYRDQDSCLEPDEKKTSFVRLVIHEGVKHQVKLMLGEIGHPVVHLHRATFGPISCSTLKQGEWRLLTEGEIQSLKG